MWETTTHPPRYQRQKRVSVAGGKPVALAEVLQPSSGPRMSGRPPSPPVEDTPFAARQGSETSPGTSNASVMNDSRFSQLPSAYPPVSSPPTNQDSGRQGGDTSSGTSHASFMNDSSFSQLPSTPPPVSPPRSNTSFGTSDTAFVNDNSMFSQLPSALPPVSPPRTKQDAGTLTLAKTDSAMSWGLKVKFVDTGHHSVPLKMLVVSDVVDGGIGDLAGVQNSDHVVFVDDVRISPFEPLRQVLKKIFAATTLTINRKQDPDTGTRSHQALLGERVVVITRRMSTEPLGLAVSNTGMHSMVTKVVSGSPAAGAGVFEGEFIVAIDGITMTEAAEAGKALDIAGTTLTLRLRQHSDVPVEVREAVTPFELGAGYPLQATPDRGHRLEHKGGGDAIRALDFGVAPQQVHPGQQGAAAPRTAPFRQHPGQQHSGQHYELPQQHEQVPWEAFFGVPLPDNAGQHPTHPQQNEQEPAFWEAFWGLKKVTATSRGPGGGGCVESERPVGAMWRSRPGCETAAASGVHLNRTPGAPGPRAGAGPQSSGDRTGAGEGSSSTPTGHGLLNAAGPGHACPPVKSLFGEYGLQWSIGEQKMVRANPPGIRAGMYRPRQTGDRTRQTGDAAQSQSMHSVGTTVLQNDLSGITTETKSIRSLEPTTSNDIRGDSSQRSTIAAVSSDVAVLDLGEAPPPSEEAPPPSEVSSEEEDGGEVQPGPLRVVYLTNKRFIGLKKNSGYGLKLAAHEHCPYARVVGFAKVSVGFTCRGLGSRAAKIWGTLG